MKTGIVLLSHGSRSPEAQVTVLELLDLVKEKSHFDYVAGAALQFNQPDLPAALAETVAAGVERVIVAPVFLYMRLHMKEDIPEILEEERKKYPGVEIIMTRNIGADKKLADIVLD
ncbi:MAG: sirohydrochlorin chelatase, partial [Desulfocucumaceae bacterium]